jgi:Zn-dependent protease with chaperone function
VTRFVLLRRSLPSVTGLFAVLFAVGFVASLGMSLWFPAVFAIVVLGIQYVLNPWLIEWLVPASIVAADHPVAELVARRCADAGIPMVRLGLVDDGTPNAFAFGRTRGDARIWLTRGLLERLDERELDAVVTHEVGHIKHLDFAVMTVAAMAPMALYLVYVVARVSRRRENEMVAIIAYVGYAISQFILLGLSRARESAADRWSCECTGDGDALASALVKVAYGIGVAHAEVRMAAVAREERRSGRRRRELVHVERRALHAQAMHAMHAMHAMGVVEPRAAEAMAGAFDGGVDPDRAIRAMRWDVVSPWARILEKSSSHPLVAHRIADLERSGIPGAPRHWSVLRAAAAADPLTVTRARLAFGREVAIMLAPYAMALLLVLGVFAESGTTFGIGLAAVGGLLLYKQAVRYPLWFQPVPDVTSLLDRLDASPMSGIPVELTGRIVGRGTPGYVLSPDLVLADDTGFVPLVYRQPAQIGPLFGLFRAGTFVGATVTARGWYRRTPGPVVELRSIYGPRRAYSWWWAAVYAASIGLLLAGMVVVLASL